MKINQFFGKPPTWHQAFSNETSLKSFEVSLVKSLNEITLCGSPACCEEKLPPLHPRVSLPINSQTALHPAVYSGNSPTAPPTVGGCVIHGESRYRSIDFSQSTSQLPRRWVLFKLWGVQKFGFFETFELPKDQPEVWRESTF